MIFNSIRINHHNVSRLRLEMIHVVFRPGRGSENKDNNMTKLVDRFLHDHSGATSIEYAVIASLLSIAIVGAVAGLGSKLKASYTGVSTALN
jgi:pilus assembly protein Flp/PilA